MNTSLRYAIVAAALALSLLTPFAVHPTTAQDGATEPVTCDATLVSLMLLAVRDYGYEPPIRFDIFNYAQYRLLAEAITGQALPEPQATLEPSSGQQAEAALQGAAADLEARGLGALGEGLANLSDEAGTLVDAGEAALQQGQAAIQAGAEAMQQSGEGDALGYGNVPGQHEYCDFLRMDLVDFLAARLQAEYVPQ